MKKQIWHLCMQQFPAIIAAMWLVYTILYEFVLPVPVSIVMLNEIVSGFIIIGIFSWRVKPCAMHGHLVAYGGACTLCMWYETYVGFGPHLAAAHWMATAVGILMLAAFAILKRKIRNKVPRFILYFPAVIAGLWVAYTVSYELGHPIGHDAVELAETIIGFAVIAYFSWRYKYCVLHKCLIAFAFACSCAMWYEIYVGFGQHLDAAHHIATGIGIAMLINMGIVQYQNGCDCGDCIPAFSA